MIGKTKFKRMLAVEASAGTGKTFALSVRYVCLLLLGVETSSIWSLTFTNKSAAEMENRVMSIITSPSSHKVELEHIADLLNLKPSTIYSKLLKLRKTFTSEDRHIVTIDSFTNQVLRSFATNLGLAADFKIGDADGYTKALEFYKFIKEKGNLSLLTDFADSTNKKLDTVIDVFSEIESSHSELAVPLSTLIVNSQTTDYYQLLSEAEITVLENVKHLSDFISACAMHTKSMLNPFQEFKTIEELVEKTVFTRDTLNYKTFAKIYSPELDELFFDLKNSIKDYFQIKELAFLVNTAMLYIYYKTVSIDLREKQNELTYTDVSDKVFAIMNNNDCDYLKFKLDSKISHILIDEFQDTSWVQYKILEPLIQEIANETENFKSFFYVGDTKQSIYRFRGGNSDLFDIVASKYSMDRETLDVNYRSSYEVVAFANELFPNLYQNFVNQGTRTNVDVGSVQVLIASDAITDSANQVVDMINNGVNQSDIALLVYTNDDVLKTMNAIKEMDPNISVVTDTNSKLINNRSVAAAVAASKFLAFGDRFYFYSFLGFTGQMESNEESISDLLTLTGEKCFNYSDEPGLYLKHLCENLGLFSEDLNLLKFIEIASSYNSIEEFLSKVDSIEESVINSAGVEGVRILTIHKSKGLEFENVIVVDKPELIQGSNKPMFFSYDIDGNIDRIWKRTPKRNLVDEEYHNALMIEKSRERRDADNAAYVAMTRAKKSMIILAYPEKSKLSNIIGLIDKAVTFAIEHQNDDLAKEIA